MSLFEGYERRIDKINGVLEEYGISSIEECKDICLAKGVDCDKIVRGTQPICFENAVWAYTVGAAIAIKRLQEGCRCCCRHRYRFTGFLYSWFRRSEQTGRTRPRQFGFDVAFRGNRVLLLLGRT